MKEEKINIPRMKEDLIELNNQIDIYLKLESDNRVGKSYMKLMFMLLGHTIDFKNNNTNDNTHYKKDKDKKHVHMYVKMFH